MNCQNTQNLLKPFFGGELQGDVLYEVRSHLASCPACRSGLSSQDLMEILPALDQSIEPASDFASRFYAKLDARRSRQVPAPQPRASRLKRPWIPEWSWRLAAAAVMAVVVATGFYLRLSPNPMPDTSAVFYEMEVTEKLSFFKDMALIEDLELFEDLDTIENLPQLN